MLYPNPSTTSGLGTDRLVASRLIMSCAVATLLALAGCDPCVPNPCADTLFCNGEETCTVDGALAVCGPGEPVMCPDSQVCDEDVDSCVAIPCDTDADCDDGDDCTSDSCLPGFQECANIVSCTVADAGCACDDGDACTESDACDSELRECVGTPKECPTGEACDPESGNCAAIMVACCLPSGMCETLSANDCANRVGAAQPEGASCDANTCPTGACCLPSRSCAITTEDACAADQGAYQGDDSSCDMIDCSNGACCFEAEPCLVIDPTGCTTLDGSYIGGGTLCETDTCDGIDMRVACCLPSGMCDFLTPDECALQVGVSQEEGATCETVACPTGACCLPSGTCTSVTENACGQDKGSYVGDDTMCDATDCAQGACCLDDADLCTTNDRSGCSFEGGRYLGDGRTCEPGVCGEEVTGAACCIGDDTCENVADEAECTELGGDVVPDVRDCPTGPFADAFAECAGQLEGVWGMRPVDSTTGQTFSSSRSFYFLSDGALVDGRPTIQQTSSGPFSFFYQLYDYTVSGSSVTAEGCAKPPNFPTTRTFTERTISDGRFSKDPCTGECILTFTETLVTTRPDGDVSTTVTTRRSVSRGDVTEAFCYRACVDSCSAAGLPGSCLREAPDPPYQLEYGDFDAWLQSVVDSRTCPEPSPSN